MNPGSSRGLLCITEKGNRETKGNHMTTNDYSWDSSNVVRSKVHLIIVVATLLMLPLSGHGAIANLGSLNLNGAANYAAFALGGSKTDNFITSNPKTTINGNGALGPSGVAQSGSDARFTGFFAVANDPQASVAGVHWVFNGGLTQALSAAVADVSNVSAYARSLTPDQTFGDITTSLTITGILNGVTVVNVGSIKYTGNQVLTLQGGANDYFVFNVSDQIKLTHSGVAIALSGGATASHVLFNLTTTSASINALDLSGRPELNGTFIAPDSNINLHSGIIDGAVMAGVDLTMVSASIVNGIPFLIPEPSSIALTLDGIALLALLVNRKRR